MAVKNKNVGPIAVTEELYYYVLQAAEQDALGNISQYVRQLVLSDLLKKQLIDPLTMLRIQGVDIDHE